MVKRRVRGLDAQAPGQAAPAQAGLAATGPPSSTAPAGPAASGPAPDEPETAGTTAPSVSAQTGATAPGAPARSSTATSDAGATAEPAELLLVATGVTKDYGSVRALDGVSIHVSPGEAVAVMGPSGCGKSTLLRIMGLMLTPSSGRLDVAAATVVDIPASNRASASRRSGINASQSEKARLRNEFFGFVHQDYAIVDEETVEANVSIPLDYARPRLKKAERRSRASAAATQLGIGKYLRAPAGKLSGGERQRVAIARAIVNNPRVILADEPTAALDGATAHGVIGALLDRRASGTAVVIATHDPRVAKRCDRVVRLLDGKLAR